MRVLMFSGLVRRDLIDKALMSGAWGYVVKSDGELGLLQAMRAVVKGEFALSRSAKLVYSRG